MRLFLKLLVIFVSAIHLNDGARILAIFQMPSKSHYILGTALARGLADKGHEVTLMTPYNATDSLPNIKNVYIENMHEIVEDYKEAMRTVYNASMIQTFAKLNGFTEKITEAALKSFAIQNLLKSDESFDLVIFESLLCEALFGIAAHFKAPFAVLSTVGSTVSNHLNGNLAPFSFVPNFIGNLRDRMTFTDRFTNTALGVIYALVLNYKTMPDQEIIYRKYFKDGPDFYELYKNVSLVMVNSHVCLETPRPYLPNMVNVGGYHIAEAKRLPEDLQNYLDDAKDGAIYFSLGSILQSADMPKEKISILFKIFAKLPQKVLWKYEEDNLEGKPDNVLIRKWFPQSDVLAHPNVKLFISHGGMLSSTEALFRGVPIIGIPFYGDQKQNTLNFVNGGYGLHVDFGTLSEESFSNTLDEILTNPIYRENAKLKSAIINDQPLKPLDNAVFWLEHIIRHKGGQHLRSVSADLTYVQFLLLDVIAFVSFILGTLLVGLVLLCKVICSKCKQSVEKYKKD